MKTESLLLSVVRLLHRLHLLWLLALLCLLLCHSRLLLHLLLLNLCLNPGLRLTFLNNLLEFTLRNRAVLSADFNPFLKRNRLFFKQIIRRLLFSKFRPLVVF